MKRVAWKKCVAGLALLALLSLLAPVPAHAAAWGGGGQTALSGSWTWIAAFWERLAAMILGGGNGPRMSPTSQTSQRFGHGSLTRKDDAVSATTTDSTGAILPTDDNGTMINPDG